MDDPLDSWTEEAFIFLGKARKLSSLAQAVLESTSHILNNQLPKAALSADAQFEQLRNLNANVTALLEHLRVRVSDHIIANYRVREKRELEPCAEKLDEVLKRLSEIEVPQILLNDHSASNPRLSDFVSTVDIENLKNSIKTYKNNRKLLNELIQNELDSLIREHLKVASCLSKTQRILEGSVIPLQMIFRIAASSTRTHENSRLVDTVKKENGALELELASLLEMLTNHYDQCVMAQNLIKTGRTDELNLDVLREDLEELHSVLREFHSIHDLILKNEERVAKFANQYLPGAEDVIRLSTEIHNSLSEFKSNRLTRFVLLLLRCEEEFRKTPFDGESSTDAVSTYVEIAGDLTYHLEQFHRTFQSQYLIELHHEMFVYPRRFLERLDDFLNRELVEVEENEKSRRHTWISKYGDFIPKELRLPGEHSQPSVVQVISEGLEEVNSESAEMDEAQLLELIKKYR